MLELIFQLLSVASSAFSIRANPYELTLLTVILSTTPDDCCDINNAKLELVYVKFEI